MKAAVVHDFRDPLRVEDVPKPGAGEIAVKIETSGLCHTDIHTARPIKLPLVPGHEGVGLVEIQHQLNTGYFLDGSHAEYTKAFAKYVGRVPESIPPAEASPLPARGSRHIRSKVMTKKKWSELNSAR